VRLLDETQPRGSSGLEALPRNTRHGRTSRRATCHAFIAENAIQAASWYVKADKRSLEPFVYQYTRNDKAGEDELLKRKSA